MTDNIDILENKLDILFHKLHRKVKDNKVLYNLYSDMYDLFIGQKYDLLYEYFWFFCKIYEYYYPKDEKMYNVFSMFYDILLDDRLLDGILVNKEG